MCVDALLSEQTPTVLTVFDAVATIGYNVAVQHAISVYTDTMLSYSRGSYVSPSVLTKHHDTAYLAAERAYAAAYKFKSDKLSAEFGALLRTEIKKRYVVCGFGPIR